jgi:hypothetical protein
MHGQNLLRRIAGMWKWGLDILLVLSALACVAIGLTALIPNVDTKIKAVMPVDYIVAVYLIIFGAMMPFGLIRVPACWDRVVRKWMVFMLSFRYKPPISKNSQRSGRGFFLIFLGSLVAGFQVWGIVVSVLCIVTGLLHFFLSCFYKDKLHKKPSQIKA